MFRRLWPILLLTAGCLDQKQQTASVSLNRFGQVTALPPTTQVAYAPATVQIAAQVDTMGRRIEKANPQLEQIGVKPGFQTIGAPQPEIFHRGTTAILITEGLARQCTSDGQLAAVLCQELGKMVAEKEALAGPRFRLPDRSPPVELRISSDSGGPLGAPDQTARAEQGFYEQQYQRQVEAAHKTPEPQALARTYLVGAGFAAGDLDAVVPLLKAASENTSFARQVQISSLPPAPAAKPQ